VPYISAERALYPKGIPLPTKKPILHASPRTATAVNPLLRLLIYQQKCPIFPQKSPIFQKNPTSHETTYIARLTSYCNRRQSSAQVLNISTKAPYNSTKEPYISKEPRFPQKIPTLHASPRAATADNFVLTLLRYSQKSPISQKDPISLQKALYCTPDLVPQKQQYIAVRGSVRQCAAVCCSVLQCVAVCCSVLQCVALCCTVSHSPTHMYA